MKIREILDIKSIAVGLTVKDKNELLNAMTELAYESGNIIDLEEARERIFAREELMPTGVGNGIALPHAKTNKIKKTVGALAILTKPIDYEALDNIPVKIVLLILGRESNIGEHLKLLSKISRMISKESFISELLAAETSDGIIELFEKYID